MSAPQGPGPNPDEVVARLRLGHETQAFEVKGPGVSDDKRFCGKVACACLGMGNLRDGGWVLIGIDDADLAAMGPGLTDVERASWTDYDTVAKRINAYADPPLRFEIHPLELPNGARAVVLEVFEFHEIPHLCAKSYPDVSREGALYVRPANSPATTEVANSTQMRAVLDLATQKALRAYLRTAQQAGATIVPSEGAGGESAMTSTRSAQLFDEQRRRAWQ